MPRQPQYTAGDQVKIVKYGHLAVVPKPLEDKGKAKGKKRMKHNVKPEIPDPEYDKGLDDYIDIAEELVGQVATVDSVELVGDVPVYTLSGIGKTGPFYENQMEAI